MNQIVIHNFDSLKEIISNRNIKKVFLVRGRNSFTATGADIFIQKLLFGIEYDTFFDFNTNPQLSDLKRGIELFGNDKYDLIIAIGGGSVLDMAKSISIFASQATTPEDIIIGKETIENKKTPLLAIPTTAGTGAETTHFAVLYIDKNKYSVAHKYVLPDIVFLSAEFTYSAGAYLTACTGLDAFCQAVESAWSINANNESIQYSIDAVSIIWNNLTKAVTESDKTAKDKMLEAAFLAGKAINITKTTAPHAISYAFTSYYGIPHGHAVALSLPFFFKYNYGVTEVDCTDPRGANEVKKRINRILNILNTDINSVEEILIQFFEKIGVNINIGELIENFDKNLIINNVNTERLGNNPRKVTVQTITDLLKTLTIN